MTKIRNRIALVLAVAMCLCATASTAFAVSTSGEIAPRSTIETIPYYQYVFETESGEIIRDDIVYRDVVVPNGCQLSLSGPSVKSTVFNSYYNNVYYAKIVRWEWSYELIK